MSSAGQPYPERLVAVDVVAAKEELRRAIRDARARRPARLRQLAGHALARVVDQIPQVRDATCVAAYVSRPAEPDTLPLIERLADRGVRVLLPVLGAGLQRDWAWFTSADDLQVRAPGRPPEPGGETLGAGALAMADAVVAPALAVDTGGTRLGQGGGWYDRVLEHARDGVVVVATVFPEEVYDVAERPLPRERHDRAVDLIATPDGWREAGALSPAPRPGA